MQSALRLFLVGVLLQTALSDGDLSNTRENIRSILLKLASQDQHKTYHKQSSPDVMKMELISHLYDLYLRHDAGSSSGAGAFPLSSALSNLMSSQDNRPLSDDVDIDQKLGLFHGEVGKKMGGAIKLADIQHSLADLEREAGTTLNTGESNNQNSRSDISDMRNALSSDANNGLVAKDLAMISGANDVTSGNDVRSESFSRFLDLANRNYHETHCSKIGGICGYFLNPCCNSDASNPNKLVLCCNKGMYTIPGLFRGSYGFCLPNLRPGPCV